MIARVDGALINGSGFYVVEGVQYTSRSTEMNAKAALQAFDKGEIGGVICTGKAPVNEGDFPFTEARLTADYLVHIGFPHSRIELEEESSSAVGNWANSVPIIQGLGWEAVKGITAKQNVRRMSRIGEFVANKGGFGFAGYYSTEAGSKLQDYIREFGVDLLLIRFLAKHKNTPLEALETAYDAFKEEYGTAAVKRFAHRKIMTAKNSSMM